MRLIDADALYKIIPAYVCVPCTFSEEIEEIEKDCKDCVVQRVMNIVDNFPTIDAVEVVHGEWKNKYMDYSFDSLRFECSKCGKLSDGRTKYCAFCGAKMDGERRDPCSSQDS